MSLGKEQPVAKKAKELKSELKQLKKDLLSAGCEKNSVNIYIKEFWEAIELGDSLQTEYEYSRACLKSAREAIPKDIGLYGSKPGNGSVREPYKPCKELGPGIP